MAENKWYQTTIIGRAAFRVLAVSLLAVYVFIYFLVALLFVALAVYFISQIPDTPKSVSPIIGVIVLLIGGYLCACWVLHEGWNRLMKRYRWLPHLDDVIAVIFVGGMILLMGWRIFRLWFKGLMIGILGSFK